MFPDTKENNPLKGGFPRVVRRFARKKNTILGLLIVFALFYFLVNVFTSTSIDGEDSSPIQKLRFSSDKELNSLKKKLETKLQEIERRELTLAEQQSKLEEEIQILRQFVEKNHPDVPKPPPKPKPDIRSENPPASGEGQADVEKREAVKEAFMHAWNGYTEKAWGTDELHPVDGGSGDWLGLGLTILDSLDTLWIMDLKDDFTRARNWVASNLNFQKYRDVSLFETTIRVMGGLLSAYDLSGDTVFLDKAQDLANRFLPAFNTKSGIPRCSVNLANGNAGNPSWTGGASILSEVGTIQLEFAYLSHHTKNSTYAEKALKVYEVLNNARKSDGLYSVYVNPDSGALVRDHITLGALGDSFYEYLLKLWILTGKNIDLYRQMYDESARGVISRLVKKSNPNGFTYIAELVGGSLVHKMDHLVCFAGAMFALGAQGETKEEHLNLGREITKTCFETYKRTATGIGPELVRFEGSNDFSIPHGASHYLLRPEAVESFFVLWRQTHDPIFREYGWEAFKAINKYCRVKYGFSGIRDVTTTKVSYDNLQQSFFLAETLKYLYLLFSDDSVIPLDQYVFNTEAHPLSVFS